MESPLSQDFSSIIVEDNRQSGWPVRAGRLELASHVRPPPSEGHNFFVRTPFRVFLDSIESPLSQDSRHVPVEGSV